MIWFRHFIKSIRGSDADATLYWMATHAQKVEDPVLLHVEC